MSERIVKMKVGDQTEGEIVRVLSIDNDWFGTRWFTVAVREAVQPENPGASRAGVMGLGSDALGRDEKTG